MRLPDPVEHALVVHQRPRADAAGEHEHVGPGVVLERAVDLDAEHRVVRADHAAFVADERDVEVGDPLEHFVGPDGVEGGEVGEQGDDDFGHGSLLSGWWRKRRR